MNFVVDTLKDISKYGFTMGAAKIYGVALDRLINDLSEGAENLINKVEAGVSYFADEALEELIEARQLYSADPDLLENVQKVLMLMCHPRIYQAVIVGRFRIEVVYRDYNGNLHHVSDYRELDFLK